MKEPIPTCLTKLILTLSLCFSGIFFTVQSQDIEYARRIIDTLASNSMHGRGYALGGDKIAAEFIEKEMNQIGLYKFNNDYIQEFYVNANTFPGNMDLEFDNVRLKAGYDYIVSPTSCRISGVFEIMRLNKAVVENKKALKKFEKSDFSKKILIIDDEGIELEEQKKIFNTALSNPYNAKAVIIIKSTLSAWATANKVGNYVEIEVKRSSMPLFVNKVVIDVENKFQEAYPTQNLVGYVKGSLEPDSFVVFTAHYDHIGCMGRQCVFPGANNDAYGVAMFLDMAQHYSEEENVPPVSMVFIFFSGDELGYLGSEYFVNNPLFPLSHIKCLINLDLMGTGQDGIKIVNGMVHKDLFKTISLINNEYGYIKEVQARGEAANSDHQSFHKKGVRSLYIYSLGGTSEYHNVLDKASTLPLSEYDDLSRLLMDFIETF